jgi:cysteine desulfurase
MVASKVEQSFVLEGLGTLSADRLSLIDVDEVGRVDVEVFAEALAGGDGVTNGGAADDGVATSGLAVLQIANHEVGTRQPWEFLTDDRLAGAVWFADATLGPLSWVQNLKLPKRVDVAALSPASWSGPLGIAILAIRNGVKFKAQVGLGADPRDARELQVAVGEPNVGLALASAAALEDFGRRLDNSRDQLTRQSELLRDLLTKEIPDLMLLGDTSETGSTPGLVAFSLLYIDGEALIAELNKRDVSITSGSSCVANAVGPSHVLVAMGALTQGNIRVSFNAEASDEDLELFVRNLSIVVRELRNKAGVTSL